MCRAPHLAFCLPRNISRTPWWLYPQLLALFAWRLVVVVWQYFGGTGQFQLMTKMTSRNDRFCASWLLIDCPLLVAGFAALVSAFNNLKSVLR
ncbi:hypothetical protein OIU77_006070 [Salix suchowensis]|uniref:Uncharacterized protein n=1 Tax=Salix suchowensis TaxID=1278906 RepID=A0ABQ9ARM5_9ROSI|nr:hypothetical protein OIU77_006070 [Salix suchowensis]